jgi:hypothetical protein
VRCQATVRQVMSVFVTHVSSNMAAHRPRRSSLQQPRPHSHRQPRRRQCRRCWHEGIRSNARNSGPRRARAQLR